MAWQSQCLELTASLPKTGVRAQSSEAVARSGRGEVPEWSNGAVSKTVVLSRVPRVRIPPSPPATPGTCLRNQDRFLSRGSVRVIQTQPVSEWQFSSCLWRYQAAIRRAVSSPNAIGIARRKYPTDEARMRWELSSWIVEAALERMGNPRLTVEEQREVLANTRTPDKVNWPDWWEVNQ